MIGAAWSDLASEKNLETLKTYEREALQQLMPFGHTRRKTCGKKL